MQAETGIDGKWVAVAEFAHLVRGRYACLLV